MIIAIFRTKKVMKELTEKCSKALEANEKLEKENAYLQGELEKAQTYSRTLTSQNCSLWFEVRELERKVKRFESGNS